MVAENRKKILVVEDERALVAAIKDKLEASGYEVLTARTSQAGLDLLNAEPDVSAIWLDHYLVGQDTGLHFLAQIKEHPGFQNLPVFVVSNTASPEKQHAYLRLGVSKYIVKSSARLEEIVNDIEISLDEGE